MSPNVLRAVAAFFAALAVVVNGVAEGKADPTAIGTAVFAFISVVSIVEASVRAHADAPAAQAHDTGAGGEMAK
jgi:hypothetical protein